MRAQLHSVKDRRLNNGEITSDDNIPDTRDVQIGLVGDQMFQRWLLDRVFHRKEMTFERGALPTITGFLTGMDSTSYSISTTTDFPPKSHIVPRHTVTAIVETGLSLHEMEERIQVLIKRFTKRIRRECEMELIPSKRMAPAQRVERVGQNSL